MFGCQQNLIRASSEIQAILEYLCSESAKLTNCGIYYSRQIYFKTGKLPNRAQLHKVLGTENRNLHYQAFYSDTAQQILTGVAESFKSFMGLLKGIKNGTVTQRPKLPGYRQSGMALVTFIDNDLLPTFGEKPEGWLPSGKRIKRGLYRTAQGWLINSDCNGAANIARKVAIILGLDLSGISRGELSAPLRLKLWS